MMVPYMRTVEMIFRDPMIANSTQEAKLDKCPADLIVSAFFFKSSEYLKSFPDTLQCIAGDSVWNIELFWS